MTKQKTIANNPGEDDCGYYAFEIAMMPSILKELRKIADDTKTTD